MNKPKKRRVTINDLLVASNEIKDRLGSVEGRLESVEERLGQVEVSIAAIYDELVSVKATVEKPDEGLAALKELMWHRLDAHDDRFDDMDKRLAAMGKKIDVRLDAMERRFDLRLDAMERRFDLRFDSLDVRFDRLDARVGVLEFGST